MDGVRPEWAGEIVKQLFIWDISRDEFAKALGVKREALTRFTRHGAREPRRSTIVAYQTTLQRLIAEKKALLEAETHEVPRDN